MVISSFVKVKKKYDGWFDLTIREISRALQKLDLDVCYCYCFKESKPIEPKKNPNGLVDSLTSCVFVKR